MSEITARRGRDEGLPFAGSCVRFTCPWCGYARETLDTGERTAPCALCGRPVKAEAMAGNGRKMAELSDRKRRAIEALLTTKSTAEAAAQSGIGARTIERWKRDPAFRDALRAASQAALHDTLAKMRAAATGRALDALTAALDEPHAPTRVRAALGLLDLATKADVDNLARRFEALEAALGLHR